MLTRRDLLNAAVGATGLALLPFAQHMRAVAAGDPAKLPKRFVFFTTANGITPSYLIPGFDQASKATGRLDDVNRVVDRPLSEVSLTDCLASLEPLKDRATCITGLSGKMTRGQHSVGYGTLGCYASAEKGKPLGETIDGALCKAFPSIFPHIGVSCNGANGVSALSAGLALPTFRDPLEVYNSLFGVISNDPRAKRRNRFDGHLLDFMAKDVNAFVRRLPAEERGKLDHYLHAYEQMGARHRQLLARRDEIKKLNPMMPAGGEMLWEDKVETMCDLIAQALIAGLTNVAAINTDGNTANAALYGKRSGFDKPTGGHGFGHGGNRRLPFGFNVSMMVKLARTLDAVPEQTPRGVGTMLDNTLLLMASTSGDSHHTRCDNFPMVLIGNCAGKLRMGRHLIIPRHASKGNSTIGTLYTTILHAAGQPRAGFGRLDVSTAKDNQIQPLAELLA